MGGLFGGGGGGSAQPATSTTPGTGQIYTPQAQPQADVAYQNLVNQLGAAGAQTGWAQPPQTWTYPQGANIAGTVAAPGQAPGTYGPYSDQAMAAAQQAASTYQNIFAQGRDPYSLGMGQAYYMAGAQPIIFDAAYSPLYAQGINNIANNPYMAQLYAGANQAANIGQQAIAGGTAGIPALGAMAQQWPQLGAQTSGTIGALARAIQGLGPGAAAQTQAAMPALQQIQGMMPGAAGQILQTSMDPQQALYNRTAQQTLDQARAINAMSGVGTSPYGAGTAQQAMQNFNINWQNQQLQRQLQGIVGATQAGQTASQLGGQLGNLSGLALNQQITPAQAAAGLYGQALQSQITPAQAAAGLYGNILGLGGTGAQLAQQTAAAPAQAYQNQQNAILNALQQQTGAAATGAGALQTLGAGMASAGQQQLSGLQALTQLGQTPYAMSTQQAQNAMNALTQATQLGMSGYQLPQAVLNDLQSYLGLGQSASNIAGQLGALSSQQMASNMAGIGLLGGLGSNALFGSQGLTGALGLSPTTGLLGGLFGAGAGAGAASSLAPAFSGLGAAAGASAPFFGGVGTGLAADVAAPVAADTGAGAAKALAPLALA